MMTTGTIIRSAGRCAAMALVLSACTGCLTDPRMAVRPYWGPGMDFAGYGPKFDWAPGALEASQDLNAPHAHKFALVQDLIEAEFVAKGYELSNSNPDFWIQYDIWKTRLGNELGYKNYIDKGGLIIEVIDPKSELLIWRCTAQSRILTSDPPDVWQDKAYKTVVGMLEKFPAAGQIGLDPITEEIDAEKKKVMTAAEETPPPPNLEEKSLDLKVESPDLFEE